MKSAYFLFILFFLSTSGFSQRLDSSQASERQKAELLAKSRTQKTIGWVLFGTGLPVVIGCTYLLASFNSNDISVNEVRTVLVASLAYTALSVPLIVAGRKNKAKALSLDVTSLRTDLPVSATACRPVLQPALRFLVRF